MGKQEDNRPHTKMNIWKDAQNNRLMTRWMDKWMHKCTEGFTYRQTDGCTFKQTNEQTDGGFR